MTETDQPIHAEGIVKVRLVRGKPVADVDALRKYHREYYHNNISRSASTSTVTASSPARAPWSGTSDQDRSASCKERGLSWNCSAQVLRSNNSLLQMYI